MNKTTTINYLKFKLATDASWGLRGLIRIYERQTEDEKASGTTNNLNSIGFSGADAEILSSFAVQYMKWNRLSPKQMAIVHKKMPRYARQLLSCIPAEKLAAVEQAASAHKQVVPVVQNADTQPVVA